MSAVSTPRTRDHSDPLGTSYRFRTQICMGHQKPKGLTPADEKVWEGIQREVATAKEGGWVVDCPNNE